MSVFWHKQKYLSMLLVMSVLAFLALMSGTSIAQETQTVDDFDSGVIDWAPFGNPAANTEFNPFSESTEIRSGLAMRVVLDFATFPAAAFAGVTKTFSSVQDWTGFNELSVYVKSNIASPGVQLEMAIDEASGEHWTQIVKSVVNSSYGQVTVSLSESSWQPDFETGDRILDVSAITKLTLTFLNIDATEQFNVFVEDIEITKAPPSSSIILSGGPVDIGILTDIAQVQDPILLTARGDPIIVNWSNTFSPPWHLLIYTDTLHNAPVYTGDFDVVSGAGMVGEFDARRAVQMKVWCENFGPEGFTEVTGPPDPANAEFFRNNETGWFRVPDISDPAYTPRRLMGLTESLDSRLANPFNVWLAADFNGAVPQSYTGTVFFEFVNE